MEEVIDHFELTHSRLLEITTDNASSNYSITFKLQLVLEVSKIKWPALTNHMSCMGHLRQLAFSVFMSSFSVKGQTKSWEAHDRDQQFGENESIDIGRSQRW